MKYYIALSKDMRVTYDNGMGYRLGKWYKIRGKDVIPPKRGFCFYDNIEDLVDYYNLWSSNIFECDMLESRFFEVEIGDKVINKNNKLFTNKIKLVRELSRSELEKYLCSNLEKYIKEGNWMIRRTMAKMKLCIDRLRNDKNKFIRAEIASQGKYLEQYKDDESWLVRLQVARQGEYLDTLKYDDDEDVKKEAVKQLELQNNGKK